MNKKRIHILLVEDEESHADLIHRSFESITERVTVTVTRSIHEARNHITQSYPDLVIADYVLPDGKGIDLVPTGKREPSYPILILTSHGDERVAVEAMKAGAFDYIVKTEKTLIDMPNIAERILREWRHNIELKKMENGLRENEARFESVLSSLYEAAVIIYEQDGNIKSLWGTSEMDERYGIRAVNIVGRSIREFVLPEEAEQRLAEIHRVFCAGEKMLVEYLVTVPNGNFWHEVSLGPMRDADGNITAVVGFIRDITERKKSEEQIRKLSHAIEQSSSTIVITDAKGNIEYANPRFTQLTGYRFEEAFGKNPRILKSGITLPEVYKKLWQTIIVGNEWRGEFCNRKKSGELYWESATISPVKNDKGVINNFIAVKDDITARKRMEEALLASEKLRSLGVIAAGIAHEFNNILSVVSGSAEVLEEGCKDEKEMKRWLDAIIKASEDGAEIVKRMLTFARAETDESDYVFFDIRQLIIQAIDFTMPRWKNMAQSEGINYLINRDGVNVVPETLCNTTELREVFVNIINNALDAMPDGGCISFRTRNDENNVFVSISDTGKGMSEEVKKRIFDPFFTTRRPQGTGLGMSLTHSIITRHGGTIEVESEAGKGSTFHLTIPVHKEVVRKTVLPGRSRYIMDKKLRVLVIDDEDGIRMLLDEYLSRGGHIVKTVSNGMEAMELTGKEDFDLILCDLAMPKVTGYDVIKFLDGLHKRPKIGLMTGWSKKVDIDGKALKVDFIIKKPFNLLELARQISEIFTVDDRGKKIDDR